MQARLSLLLRHLGQARGVEPLGLGRVVAGCRVCIFGRNAHSIDDAYRSAARVAAGAIAKRILSEFDISVISFVIQIGSEGISDDIDFSDWDHKLPTLEKSPLSSGAWGGTS